MPNDLHPQGVCEQQGRRIEALGLLALVLLVDARRGFRPTTHSGMLGGTHYAINVNFRHWDVNGGPSHLRRTDS
jgi:hypothetical protein